MSAHSSAYNVNITFGKYKGSSLGYIFDINKNYLVWLSENETSPMIWREAAAKVLLQEDISSFDLSQSDNIIPRAIVNYIGKDKLSVRFGYDRNILERFKFEVDGRKWNPEEKYWEVPAVQIMKIVHVFGGTSNIDADDKTKKIWREEKKRRTDLDTIRVKDDSDIDIPLKLPLFPYQKVAVEFADRAHGRAMIADQMGLGKTVVALGFAEKKNYKTLVVCPKSVVTNWMREIKRFTGKNPVCWVSGEGRLGRSDARYQVINYDIVDRYIKDLNSMKFDLLVCDEATFLKNRRTKRSKSVLGSFKERKKFPGVKAPYCLFLTGTPVLNRPVEAYHLLNYLDKNRFNNFYHFVTKYGGWRGDEPQNLEDLHERTKDLIIRRVKRDVLSELPDKQRNDLYVEMSPLDTKEYNNHLNDLFRKWRQLGKPTVAEMPEIQRFLIKKKLPKAIEMIDELIESDRGVLIFSVYIEPLKYLKKHYGKDASLVYGQMKQSERQESIDDLSNGRTKVGLFSLGAGSMGIDGVQHQISTVLFLDQWWVPSVHEQAEDRIHRIGQNSKVQVFYLLCENTIDEYMRQILAEKQRVIDTVVDGKLITIKRDKSFFKEFVQLLNKNYHKQLKEFDIDGLEEEVKLTT